MVAVAYERLSLTRGCRLQEVVAYERLSRTRGSKTQWFEWETFGILENWSLRRGGRHRDSRHGRFDCIFSFPVRVRIGRVQL